MIDRYMPVIALRSELLAAAAAVSDGGKTVGGGIAFTSICQVRLGFSNLLLCLAGETLATSLFLAVLRCKAGDSKKRVCYYNPFERSPWSGWDGPSAASMALSLPSSH